MKKRLLRLLIFGVYVALIALGIAMLLRGDGDKPKPPAENYTQLIERVRDGKVKKLETNPQQMTVTVTETDADIPAYQIGVPPGETEGFDKLLRLAERHDVTIESAPVQAPNEGPWAAILRALPTLLFILIIGLIALYYFRNMNQVGIEPAPADVSFDDVAGCGEAVEELKDVRSFLSDPKRFERLGARVPKGVLLYGPPGTGKTLLAKAVANEAGIPFFSASGSEFIEMFAGLGAKRVRQLFDRAKKAAPSIVFIDELDAVGGHRSPGGGDGASREADQTLIQILKEMDGFVVNEHPVIVIGATNRLEALDRALTRPGRFDRHIAIDPPDRRGRREIIAVHAKDKRFAEGVDFDGLASHTSGMTGADLALILNEAALLAARRGATEIGQTDIDDAYFRVVAGAKKQHRVLSERERRIVAYHEVGHALVGERLGGATVVHKISIIPRGQSGGQTLYVSADDVFLQSEQDLLDHLCGLLGGRAAEQLIVHSVTSGPADDLKRATSLAYRMVTELGMSKALGLRVVTDDAPISSRQADRADDEVKDLIARASERALAILQKDEKALRHVAETLLVEETIDRDRFLELLREAGAPSLRPRYDRGAGEQLALPAALKERTSN